MNIDPKTLDALHHCNEVANEIMDMVKEHFSMAGMEFMVITAMRTPDPELPYVIGAATDVDATKVESVVGAVLELCRNIPPEQGRDNQLS